MVLVHNSTINMQVIKHACHIVVLCRPNMRLMVVSRQDNISVQVDHEGESLEQVHDFKFLGSYKSADGSCTK